MCAAFYGICFYSVQDGAAARAAPSVFLSFLPMIFVDIMTVEKVVENVQNLVGTPLPSVDRLLFFM